MPLIYSLKIICKNTPFLINGENNLMILPQMIILSVKKLMIIRKRLKFEFASLRDAKEARRASLSITPHEVWGSESLTLNNPSRSVGLM